MKTAIAAAIESVVAQRRRANEPTQQAVDKEHRMTEFGKNIAAAQPVIQRLTVLREQRQELLADVATGAADAAVIDRADTDMLDARAAAASAERTIEVATAGIARLRKEHEALQPLIASETAKIAPLSYAALREILVNDAMPQYHEAAKAFGQSMANVMGVCAAVDAFADSSAGRPYTTGLSLAPVWTPWLPQLASIDEGTWLIDTRKLVEPARLAALKAIEG